MVQPTTLADALNAGLPASSEFRSGYPVDARAMRRGRQLAVPLSTTGVANTWNGSLFSSPSTQPGPTEIVREHFDKQERDVTLYLSWAPTPANPPAVAQPVTPFVYALVRWGVGGATFSRMLDVHGVPRRMSLTCNFLSVAYLYFDAGDAGLPASVQGMVGIALGESDPSFWGGTWISSGITSLVTFTAEPTALLAASGTLISLPGGASNAYVLFVDKASNPVGGELAIPGGVTPLLSVGDSFSFGEDDDPGVFADFGLSFVISSSPTAYVPLGGGVPTAALQAKCAVNA